MTTGRTQINLQKCSLHRNEDLDFYCQSCEDPICNICKTQQPHSGFFHKVIPLAEALERKITHYKNYVDLSVNPVRFRIGERIQQLKKDRYYLENCKNAILKDINVEYMNIDQNLRTAASNQILKYQTSIKHRQSYINILDDLSYSFENVMNNPAKFLIFAKQIDQQLNKLESLELQQSIPQSTINLPRGVKQAYNKLQLIPQLQQKNQMLNIMVQKAIGHYQAACKKKQKQIKDEEKRILKLYIDMNYTLANISQAKICIYCSNPFSIDLCNDPCSQNRTFNATKVYPNFQVPQQCRGVKRHFWVDAGLQHRKKPEKEAHSLVKSIMKKQFQNSLKDIKSVKYQIEKYLLQKGTTLQKIFKRDDTWESGKVSRISFIYHLTKDFGVAKVHAEHLADLLSSEQGIKYKELFEVVEKPQVVYESFVKQQEQYEREKPVGPKTTSSTFKCRY